MYMQQHQETWAFSEHFKASEIILYTGVGGKMGMNLLINIKKKTSQNAQVFLSFSFFLQEKENLNINA